MSFSIVVNGKATTINKKVVTYEELCRLVSTSESLFTITYKVPNTNISGELTPNNSVEIHPRMIFNIMNTGNS